MKILRRRVASSSAASISMLGQAEANAAQNFERQAVDARAGDRLAASQAARETAAQIMADSTWTAWLRVEGEGPASDTSVVISLGTVGVQLMTAPNSSSSSGNKRSKSPPIGLTLAYKGIFCHTLYHSTDVTAIPAFNGLKIDYRPIRQDQSTCYQIRMKLPEARNLHETLNKRLREISVARQVTKKLMLAEVTNNAAPAAAEMYMRKAMRAVGYQRWNQMDAIERTKLAQLMTMAHQQSATPTQATVAAARAAAAATAASSTCEPATTEVLGTRAAGESVSRPPPALVVSSSESENEFEQAAKQRPATRSPSTNPLGVRSPAITRQSPRGQASAAFAAAMVSGQHLPGIDSAGGAAAQFISHEGGEIAAF